MGGFIFGAIVVLILWAFFSAKSKANSSQAFNALDEAKVWFDKKGIITSSVNFSSYNDPYLSKSTGATVLVGIGKKVNGDRIGFAIEVKQGLGVIESSIIEPFGIASQHKQAVQVARLKDKSLIDALQELALHHRLNNVQ